MAAVTRRQYKGAAASTTITASLTNVATTTTLTATTGWPSSAGVPFTVVIDPGTSSEEKCSATISGSTLTLTRGVDDTTAVSHAALATIYPVFSADEADEANQFASTMTTRGDLLTMGSGPTVGRIAIGTSGQILTSDGTDAAWATAAGGGLALSQIASGTLPAATSLTISSLSAYDKIVFMVYSADKGTNSKDFVRINADSGSNYYQVGFTQWHGNGAGYWGPDATSTAATSFALQGLDSAAAANNPMARWMTFENCKSSGFTTFRNISHIRESNFSTTEYTWTEGMYISAAAVSSIVFHSSSGNWNAGSYRIWAG